MSEDTGWRLQDTLQGLDAQGLTHMLNLRANTVQELKDMRNDLSAYTAQWKALPIKSFGGGGKPQETKLIKTWADVPKCPTHNEPAYPNEWKGHDKYFWNCASCQSIPFDQRPKIGFATKEQFDAFQLLDPDERPKPNGTTGAVTGAGIALEKLKVLRAQLKGTGAEVPPLHAEDIDTEAKILSKIAITMVLLKAAEKAAL